VPLRGDKARWPKGGRVVGGTRMERRVEARGRGRQHGDPRSGIDKERVGRRGNT
jgi:hypothetical protein